jgi:hypothetical protein
MIRESVVGFFLLLSTITFAQNIKTGVLVVGGNASAYAAAIQSAKSGVKTVLIDAGKLNQVLLTAADRAYKIGIYADFVNRVDSLQKSPLKSNENLTPDFTARVFKSWTDTVKNLTVIPNASIKKIKKSGKGWEVDLQDREIKADALVDATTTLSIASKVGVNISKKNQAKPQSSVYSDKKYRTSLALSDGAEGAVKMLPLSSFIAPTVENLVLVAPLGETPTLLGGQAAGVIAAYCAFFDKTTKQLQIRQIQSELLTFKSHLIKFDDIVESDSSMIAFQHIGVTGILKAKEQGGKLLFMPDSNVSTEDLRQPFREYYSRSQIWFLDNKVAKLTVNDALSLIKFVGSRGEELNREVENAWNKTLKLKGKFDLKRLITRREIAVLFDVYLQPFGVPIDMEGNVTR